MRALHIIPSITLLGGGSNIATIEIVKALRKSGIEIEIATSNDNFSGVLDVPLNCLTEYQGVPVRFFPKVCTQIKSIDQYTISFEYLFWLWNNIDKYDLIHIHSFFSFFCTSGAIIARIKKVKFLFTCHGQLDPWVINQGKLKKQIYGLIVERKNLQSAAAIHCTTAQEACNVVNFGINSPTCTIPLGVNQLVDFTDAKRHLCEMYGLSYTTPIILFLSRFHPKKNLELLLEALSHLKENYDFHIILAGSGDREYTEHISELVSSFKLNSCTTFTGFVEGQTKALLLQGSDIFALSSFGENFGIAVAEAMASGLPVIITPEVQISLDVLAANAGLVVPSKLDAWISGLKQLLVSPELRDLLGKNGKSLVNRQYNWSALGEKMSSVYNAIVQNKPLPK